MKNILGAIFGSLLLVVLNSCASSPEQKQAKQNYYDAQAPMTVCMGYMTNDWFNVNQKYREQSIIKRNIDCRPYIELAARKHAMDRAAWDSLYRAVDSLGTSGTTTQSSSSSSSSFKTEEINGTTKICYYQTLSGVKAYNTTATTLCPMSYPY